MSVSLEETHTQRKMPDEDTEGQDGHVTAIRWLAEIRVMWLQAKEL